jgi:hypothetical protein
MWNKHTTILHLLDHVNKALLRMNRKIGNAQQFLVNIPARRLRRSENVTGENKLTPHKASRFSFVRALSKTAALNC